MDPSPYTIILIMGNPKKRLRFCANLQASEVGSMGPQGRPFGFWGVLEALEVAHGMHCIRRDLRI